MEIKPFGDTAIRISFGDQISMTVNKRIRSLVQLIRERDIPAVQEWIPAYTSVTVIYDPAVSRYESVRAELEKLQSYIASTNLPSAKRIRLPVYYGGESGPDLANVAEINGLTPDEAVKLHSSHDYYIFMIGFTPGFPYLGGMPKALTAPRLTAPRKKVPQGSVGIAGEQTGVYSLTTPGGWQIIGHTPVRLYDPDRDPPVLLESGDYLRFDPVSSDEYSRIVTAVSEGTYQLLIESYNESTKES
ncbi:5-oxoprolinase subunit PxpB [Salisediminibacterium halotolerans]|uniref:5-oxoprolinase subunit PxpB n=1 Tax=Salisediminibacterium halotolerans TaxID=517425 RepID=UPI000EB45480|nr:5-oxoprolinase subunit PxpB [Salisediminibacterium halotolerans]RLJ78357.1 inhibitor of KinA [Actinophytocola xinjiangensis]RPE88301.1 inhibitor of KinA [Salisediminibacterium halotolerans]TWG37333.1 inhibitor of KinA [Salisediminibacterium halotolerans]GEL06798.1 allophanate hydrolase [Salisediminibacterium halotolerans]